MTPPHPSLAYRAIIHAAVPVVPIVLRDPRNRAAHAGRRAAPERLERWARALRDPTRPLAWFHAPSVGEGLQARVVMSALHAMLPDLQFVYTHYSPSAEEFATTVGADWAGYLCYDRGRDVQRMLDAAAPDLLVFTKLDLWPELATRAAARGTRVAMVAATVNGGSGRLRWPARWLAHTGYASLDLGAAISADDAERLVQLGCPRNRIQITGDPRIDSVLEVVDRASAPIVSSEAEQTLVAGSTWPEDEAVVLATFAQVRAAHPNACLIIAPHEPTASHLSAIERLATQLTLPAPVRLGALSPEDRPAIVLVDRTGVLVRLYASGALAYVGGGFGEKGIHSVLEPAAWGRPVIIGPRDRGSRDAALLDAAGALIRLSGENPASKLALNWSRMLAEPGMARDRGNAARAALEAERGAAARSAELLEGLLQR